ncbi:MAG: hypothetical protein ACI35P_05740 [Bacillus sp. (in: firmicutes)]
MINYLKLVDFEIKRFWKVYVVLLASVIIIQPITVLILVNGERDYIKKNPLEHFHLSTFTGDLPFFYLPIMICIATLTLYLFFTWYREWFGKSTFSIQLLLLPFNRMTVYYAKLTALLFFIFGCIVTQLGSYFIVYAIYKATYPQFADLDNSLVTWINSDSWLTYLIPTSIIDFFLFYGLGIVVVIVLFSVILLERAFRYKGLIVGVIYGIACIILFFVPDYISYNIISLYEDEILLSRIVISSFITICSLWLSHYLMKKQIWM